MFTLDDILVFKTYNNYYFYDKSKNDIVRISKELYLFLTNCDIDSFIDYENSKKSRELNNEIKNLKKEGFFKKSKINLIIHPYTEFIESILDRQLNAFVLQVTQNCNFRCEYCTYSGSYNNRTHSNKRMSFELAKKGLDFFIEHSVDSNELSFGFYGGEPLLEFDLIKKCIDYIKNTIQNKKIYYHMTTNGSLLDVKTFDFLYENNFNLLVSVGGPSHIHNKRRKFANGKDTFDVILNNIKKIKEKYIDFDNYVRFNAVIDPETDFNCYKEFFMNCDDFLEIDVRFAPINNINIKKRNKKSKNNLIVGTEYDKFLAMLNTIGKVSKNIVSSYGLSFIEDICTSIPKYRGRHYGYDQGHPSGPCIPGYKKLFMNVDGIFYPCERVPETNKECQLGNIYDGIKVEKAKRMLNIGTLTNDNCKNCICFHFCNSCIAHGLGVEGLSKEKRLSFCNSRIQSFKEKLVNYCILKEYGAVI